MNEARGDAGRTVRPRQPARRDQELRLRWDKDEVVEMKEEEEEVEEEEEGTGYRSVLGDLGSPGRFSWLLIHLAKSGLTTDLLFLSVLFLFLFCSTTSQLLAVQRYFLLPTFRRCYRLLDRDE